MTIYMCPLVKICPVHERYLEANNKLVAICRKNGEQEPSEVTSPVILSRVPSRGAVCSSREGLARTINELNNFGVVLSPTNVPYYKCILEGVVGGGESE